MNYSVIDELYYENLSPIHLLQNSKEYQQLSTRHADAIDLFQQSLDESQAKQVEALLQQSLDITSSETKAYFHAGFCMGARIMQEVTDFPS